MFFALSGPLIILFLTCQKKKKNLLLELGARSLQISNSDFICNILQFDKM